MTPSSNYKLEKEGSNQTKMKELKRRGGRLENEL